MHKSSISSVEIATGMFMLLLNSLFLPMFCYLPFILRYFICVYFISFPLSFHARYFHVLPLSVHIHILSLSLHAMSKSSQIEYSECMTLVTMVVTIYMCEYWKNKYTLIQKHFLSCSHSFHAFHSPVSFLSLPSMFLLFPSIISLFYVHLI